MTLSDLWRRIAKDPVRQDSLGTVLGDAYDFAASLTLGSKKLAAKAEEVNRRIEEQEAESG